MKKFFFFLLIAFTAAITNAQSITVSAPNGGEQLYACQSYTITWSASGTSNYYDLDYSLNNGAIWASIASNINIVNGQYVWTVPNVESGTCLIRVRDKNDTSKNDISNANFAIHIPVVITAPNAGEIWQGGTQHLITWDIQGTSLTFNLDYSINNGTTWLPITTNLSTSSGSYNWTVPNNPSTQCLVRVRDAVTNCMQDVSNNIFTITPAQPILTAPNGGQVFSWGAIQTITWNAASFFSTVRLEYSIDNGATWILISATETNDGSYSWIIPNVNSTTCLIKASNSANVSSNDVSNATFSILQPTVTITTPNGGESWLGCDAYNIGITVNNAPSALSGSIFNLYLSTDGGTTWSSNGSITATSALSYTYNWTIPNTINSTQCLFRVSNNTYASMLDTSNAVFSIQTNNVVTVTSPNGGEIIPALGNAVITWTNTAGASGLYNVFYHNGTSLFGLASGISGNSFNWTNIPNVPGSNYYVQVSDAGNTCRKDQSNANFTVTAAQPVLTYPNGGQTFNWGATPTITWNTATFYSPVRLEYSLDNGITWIVIVTSVTNSGSYVWATVPNVNVSTCLIKASNTANLSSFDISNATFTIKQPGVTITSPNGGENWLGCDAYNIGITVNNAPSALSGSIFNLYLSTDGGTTWSSNGSITATSALSYTFNWTIPNTINSTQCLFRVSNNTYASMLDTSNAVFSIQTNNVVTVTSPDGGEIIPALGNAVITWTNTAGASGLYNVFYHNGTSLFGLASGISGNSYNWTNIPNVPGSNYYVQVSDAGNTCRTDKSNANFTVTAAQPVLTYPNGGQTFNWGATPTITWNAATFYSPVRLEYSLDNGITWIVIVTSVTNSGSYVWATVPNVNVSTCLIKASNTANLSSFDISNATFTIKQPGVTITSPNGGENWLGCDAYNIGITVNNAPSALSGSIFNLYLSTDGGTTWSSNGSITATSALSYTFNWTIPNTINSTQCLFRVSNNTYATMLDTSNAVFSIQTNNVVTVTSPNGGEIIPALGNAVITWTNTAGASGLYNVFYHNGTSLFGLASGISGNSFNWTNIPNVPGSNYYVQVSDAGNTCRTDKSNANFTVTAAQPVLTYPNGGQTFNWGATPTITWNTATFYSPVRLEYSLDNGITWMVIVTSVTNSGSYVWATVPNVNVSTCLIKASNTANLSSFDISNATFTIKQPGVTITSPNGGENWLGCDAYNIGITVNNAPSALSGSIFNLYLSTDGGTTWSSNGSITATSALSYTFNWTIPNTINSTQCLFRVSNNTYATMLDTSNAVFSIQTNNVVTVTSPDGGEIIPALGNAVITWTNTAGASGLYNVFYHNGTSLFGLASGISGNSFNWTNIPNVPGSNYYVQVSDAGNTCRTDKSNANFTVTAAQPVLTYPNGGQTFNWGATPTITWNAATFYSPVRLEYSLDNGITWIVIVTSVTNSGSYVWANLPNVNASTCLIKASNTANLSSFDVSNATFSIKQPGVTITSPNGGENWLGCDAYNIGITVNNAPSPLSGTIFNLYLSTDGGATWSSNGSITATTASSYTYNWTIPNTINSTQCLFRVSNNTYATMLDTSNAVFSIQTNNVVTVTSPNGGEVFPALTGTTITWTNTAGASGLYNVTYYNGSFTTTLASGISGNSFNWTSIPNVPGSNNYVRVFDAGNTCKFDQSNTTFTVTAAQPVLTYPNGGEQFLLPSTYNITWDQNTFYSPVRLEYSLNNGVTWIVITTSTANNGTYAWTVPFANSTSCLIKASNTANVNSYDISNATFKINTPVPVLTYPNGGEQLWAGSTYNITWNVASFYQNVRLEYSLDNGITWILISAAEINDGSYAWIVEPTASSATCLIKASNSTNVSINDVSNATFTIKPAIKILTPNGLEQLGACTQTSISVEHSPAYATFVLLYSINNGQTWTTIGTSAYTGTTGTTNWSIPNLPTTQALIKAYVSTIPAAFDISDSNFTIKPAVTLIQPNFGGLLQVGTVYPVKWSSDGISNLYDLAYSTAGNTGPWTNIAIGYNTATNTYNWTVPNIPSTNCYIRVRDNAAVCKEDISNLPFTISSSSSPITVVASNGGDTLNGCQNYTISWTESGIPLGAYKIDLSPDGGITWNTISANYATTGGTYGWVVPNINTDQALIRVGSPTVSTLYDVSNAAFTIQSRKVKAIPDTIVCSGASVNLQATGGVGNYSWSPVTYLNNPGIANPVATPTASINYIVSSTNGSCVINDTATIVVQQTPVFSITRDGGNVCSNQPVTFTAHLSNGGANPAFLWKKNNANIGTNDSVLVLNNLMTGDSVYCMLTFSPSCFAPVKSNTIGIVVSEKPNLGNDTAITVSCPNCTVNLTALYNTTGYVYVNWNTATPTAATPGIYRLVVSQLNGCTCPDTDTAYVNVSTFSGLINQACVGGAASFLSNAVGSTYQWQVDDGNGFTAVNNDVNYAGANQRSLAITNVPSTGYGFKYRCLVNGAAYSDVFTLKFSNYWTGAANTDWENPGNWGCGTVPDKNTDVFIYGGKTNYPEVNCNRVCRSIYAAPTTSLTVKDNKLLLLRGK